MDIGKRLVQLEAKIARLERSSRLANASLDDAALEVRDAGGSLRAVVGQQPDGTTAVNVVNGPTPPVPSAPTVEPALAALAVTWNGTFAGGAVAPLDWMRCEVHIGPTADFTPDQGTLRDTIESPQGGTVTIPLPYSEWFVKLRSRTTSGVASAATAAVAATPRKAAAADITAGAVTAQALAADAITGKTVTGGLVTGAIVQTGASGQRVVLTTEGPDAEASDGTSPAVALYSGDAAEQSPGILLARTSTAWVSPAVILSSPARAFDNHARPVDARLELAAPQVGDGGRFLLTANNALSGDLEKLGEVSVHGSTASATNGESSLWLECISGVAAPGGNGVTLGPRSHFSMYGSEFRLRSVANTIESSLYVRPTGTEATGSLTAGSLSVSGTITAGNVDHGTVNAVMNATSSVDVPVTFSKTFPATPRVVATLRGNPTLPSGSSSLIVRAFNITTTGCTLRVNDIGGVARTLTHAVDWIARS